MTATKSEGKTDAADGFAALLELAQQAGDLQLALLRFRQSAGFAAVCDARPDIYGAVESATAAVGRFGTHAANVALLDSLTRQTERATAELAAIGC